jgi:hypothetical protein
MDLSAGTAGTWVNRIGGDKVIPLIELLREAIFIPEFGEDDETWDVAFILPDTALTEITKAL